MLFFFFFFFFSSRRRHTRWPRDWSSDVCSSDLPLGAGVRWACHLGGVELGSTVLILGAGQRGLAAVLAARAAGAGTIIVTGLARDGFKLGLAQEFGADYVINVEAEDTVSRVQELTGGDGVDVALDLT